MHTADGSDKGSCTIKIKGLKHHFPPPLPEIEPSKPAAALVTATPDYDLLDAQGRKEDRDALKLGADAKTIAATRRKRQRPSQVVKEETDEKDSDEYMLKGEKAWEVESVVDKRRIGGQVQYRVKWKNCGEEENTWEPWDGLTSARKAILDFNKSLKKIK